jgi:DNA invertase Pin-like site-specific DNA recombinase
MATNQTIPAAQYLRMSTEHQQYSLLNQSDAILQYASAHGFRIIDTYSDAATSGVLFRKRKALQRLIQDVVQGEASYRAILVYDVSRWGRFRDTDEAAHYEFLCKSAGVPVHYCAETFSNDGNLPGLIMKSLKRAMAGEYSRELSVKVRAGQFRLAKQGYQMGGPSPFGLRRQLLDTDGHPKQLLKYREVKSVVNERVVLVPGPPSEIAIVERIFYEFADEHRGPTSIAHGLNRDNVKSVSGQDWTEYRVANVLRNAKYLGIQMWGQTASHLSGRPRKLPQESWAVCPHAFKPIVSPELFSRAQARFANLTHNLSNEQMLERLRDILLVHGKLTNRLIDKSRSCPGASTYRKRFKGGLLHLYGLLGYDTPDLCAQASKRQLGLLARSALIDSLIECFPQELQEARKGRQFRALLRFRRTGLLIAVVLAHQRTYSDTTFWRLDAPKAERKRPVILGLLNEEHSAIQSVWVIPQLLSSRLTIRGSKGENWLRSGEQLDRVSDFLCVLERVRRATPPR